MPKKRVNFDSQLSFQLSNEMRRQLVALAYLRGDRGSYAGVSRQFLADGISESLRNMNAAQRARYDEILANVLIEEEQVRAMAGYEQVTE